MARKKTAAVKPEPAKRDRNTITVALQARHSEWLRRRAKIDGESVERTVEKIIREAYARDYTKGGQIAPHVGGSFKAGDMAQAVENN